MEEVMSVDRQHPTDENILRYIDQELTAMESDRLRNHLSVCAECRERQLDLRSTASALADIYRSELPASDPYRAEPKERLQRAIAKIQVSHLSSRKSFGAFSSHYGLSIAILGSLVILFAGLEGSRAWNRLGDRNAQIFIPNKSLTPGAARPVTLAEVCAASDNDLDPTVSPSLQKAVFEEYGIQAQKRSAQYQIDYLINPQLGGTNDIRNLWPESYADGQWNARAKDELERRLQQMVCAGTVDLTVAQQEIASDWIGAYKKYVSAAQSSQLPRPSEIATLSPHFP
jgi:hypothetical protein